MEAAGVRVERLELEGRPHGFGYTENWFDAFDNFFRSGLLSVQCADVPTNGDVSQPAHCFSQGRIGHSERRAEP